MFANIVIYRFSEIISSNLGAAMFTTFSDICAELDDMCNTLVMIFSCHFYSPLLIVFNLPLLLLHNDMDDARCQASPPSSGWAPPGYRPISFCALATQRR